MILSLDQVRAIFPLNSEQCVILGIRYKGTKMRELVGIDVTERQYEHVTRLCGLRRNQCSSLLNEREETLRLLGFGSYSDYLDSPLWSKTKRRVYELRGTTCLCCFDKQANVIHHEMYSKSVLLGRPSAVRKWLVPLCNDCHHNRHFDGDKWRKRFTMRPITTGLLFLGNGRDDCGIPRVIGIEALAKDTKISIPSVALAHKRLSSPKSDLINSRRQWRLVRMLEIEQPHLGMHRP